MYRSVLRVTLVGLTCLALACGGDNKVNLSELNDDLGMPATVADYGRLSLSFEANRGQTDEQVKFLSRGNGYTVFLAPNEAVLALREPGALEEALVAFTAGDAMPMTVQDRQVALARESAQGSAPTVLRMRLRGADPDPQVVGLEQLPGKSNYFIGNNPEEWHTNVPHYAKVKYQDVYPGIDLVYYGNQGQLEYDFVIAPGADPGVIRLTFEGAEQLVLDEDGNLSVSVPGGTILQSAPVIYQETGEGTRTTIPGRYVVDGAHEVRFDVAPYDASRPLIIDPVVVFSTFLGGSDIDGGLDIAVDADGNAYVTGLTLSPDFPTVNPYQPLRASGSAEIFVTKISAAGDQILYSTYLGDLFTEAGLAIAVDAAGSAYVTGITQSPDFPTMNPIQNVHGGTFPQFDAFVAKLDSTGQLEYSTFLGGNGHDFGYDIAVDVAGNAYVTGETSSPDFNTTASPLQAALLGSRDAFVTKINVAGTAFVYSTFLGSSTSDRGLGIAADAAGNAYVTGHTSFTTNFTGMSGTPAGIGIPHIQESGSIGTDAFVVKINATGSAFVWATFLAGGHNETGRAIAVDAAGNAYVTGGTSSGAPDLDPPFPGTPGSPVPAAGSSIQPAYGGGLLQLGGFNFGGDAFVTKINAAGDALLYSTYLGGSDFDHGLSIAADAAGNAYVAGFTLSSDFPTVNPTQAAYGGGDGLLSQGAAQGDGFVAKINAAGDALVFSTFLGGSADEGVQGVAVDAAGNVYVTGSTLSADFLTSVGALDTTLGGTEDAFVVKLAFATEEQVAIVAADIEDLVVEGTLSGGQAAALMATLDTGLRMLTDAATGNDIAGMNLLLALVNQVQGLIDGGILTLEEGQPLIDVANAIIDDFLAG